MNTLKVEDFGMEEYLEGNSYRLHFINKSEMQMWLKQILNLYGDRITLYLSLLGDSTTAYFWCDEVKAIYHLKEDFLDGYWTEEKSSFVPCVIITKGNRSKDGSVGNDTVEIATGSNSSDSIVFFRYESG